MAKGRPRRWTAEQDAKIVGLKAQGRTWEQVSRATGLPVDAVTERGYRLRVPKGAGGRPRAPAKAVPPERAEAALEPGHAFTWNPLWPGSAPPDFKSVR